jgi:hypothetical protein
MCKVKDGMSAQIDDLVNEHYGVAHMAQAMNAAANNNQGNGSYRSGPGGLIYHAQTDNSGAQSTVTIKDGVITDVVTKPLNTTINGQPGVINPNGTITIKTEGIKHDNEKPDLSLLPREFLDEVAKAMMYGEKKYGRYNYTGGMAWHRIIAACLRHVTAFASGEDTDRESGVSHLGHAGACVLMLTVYYKRNLGTDTREKK